MSKNSIEWKLHIWKVNLQHFWELVSLIFLNSNSNLLSKKKIFDANLFFYSGGIKILGDGKRGLKHSLGIRVQFSHLHLELFVLKSVSSPDEINELSCRVRGNSKWGGQAVSEPLVINVLQWQTVVSAINQSPPLLLFMHIPADFLPQPTGKKSTGYHLLALLPWKLLRLLQAQRGVTVCHLFPIKFSEHSVWHGVEGQHSSTSTAVWEFLEEGQCWAVCVSRKSENNFHPWIQALLSECTAAELHQENVWNCE